MGVTVLQIEPVGATERGARNATLSFSRRGLGAQRWQTIVDAFDDALELLEASRAFAAGRPDGDLSLGRGGRRVIPSKVVPLLIGAWQAVPAVRDALDSGELRIDGDGGPLLVVALARRWVAMNREPTGGGWSAGLESYFE